MDCAYKKELSTVSLQLYYQPCLCKTINYDEDDHDCPVIHVMLAQVTRNDEIDKKN